MIDTDKYEGHTPAPWNADDDGGGKYLHIDAYGEEGDVCVARMVNGNWIDTQLIADAPLLLAELKRLEKRLDFAQEVMDDQTAVEFHDLILESEGEEDERWEDERCPECQEEHHDTCPLVEGCSCCEWTMKQMLEEKE